LNARTTAPSPWRSNPHNAVKANGAQTFPPPPKSRNPTSSSAVPAAGVDLQSNNPQPPYLSEPATEIHSPPPPQKNLTLSTKIHLNLAPHTTHASHHSNAAQSHRNASLPPSNSITTPRLLAHPNTPPTQTTPPHSLSIRASLSRKADLLIDA
jgi:hypothetical protein